MHCRLKPSPSALQGTLHLNLVPEPQRNPSSDQKRVPAWRLNDSVLASPFLSLAPASNISLAFPLIVFELTFNPESLTAPLSRHRAQRAPSQISRQLPWSTLVELAPPSSPLSLHPRTLLSSPLFPPPTHDYKTSRNRSAALSIWIQAEVKLPSFPPLNHNFLPSPSTPSPSLRLSPSSRALWLPSPLLPRPKRKRKQLSSQYSLRTTATSLPVLKETAKHQTKLALLIRWRSSRLCPSIDSTNGGELVILFQLWFEEDADSNSYPLPTFRWAGLAGL